MTVRVISLPSTLKFGASISYDRRRILARSTFSMWLVNSAGVAS
jgi:hypothetical protein